MLEWVFSQISKRAALKPLPLPAGTAVPNKEPIPIYSDNVVLHGNYDLDVGTSRWCVIKGANGGYFYAQTSGIGVHWFHADTYEDARDLGENFRASAISGWMYK